MQQSPGASGEAPVTKPTNEDDGGVEQENRKRYADSSDEEKSVTPPRGGIRPVSAVSGVEESLAEPEIRGLWEDSRADSKSRLISAIALFPGLRTAFVAYSTKSRESLGTRLFQLLCTI